VKVRSLTEFCSLRVRWRRTTLRKGPCNAQPASALDTRNVST
jgi:hypothetical protein